MVIPPIIFIMVTIGIVSMGDVKKVGKVGGKANLYFDIITIIALAFGLVMVNILKPGVGLNLSQLDKADISTYTEAAKQSHTFVDFLFGIIPPNIVDSLLNNIKVITCWGYIAFSAINRSILRRLEWKRRIFSTSRTNSPLLRKTPPL